MALFVRACKFPYPAKTARPLAQAGLCLRHPCLAEAMRESR